MIEIKYKKISESSLNYFSKTIYSDIQKFHKNALVFKFNHIQHSNYDRNISDERITQK